MEHAAASRVDGEERTPVQGQSAETFGGISGDASIHHDLAATQEHRGLVADAVVVLDLQVAVVVELQAGVIDDEFGDAGEGAVVAQVERAAGVDEPAAERGGRVEVDRGPVASTEEVQRGAGDLPCKRIVALTVEDEVGRGG